MERWPKMGVHQVCSCYMHCCKVHEKEIFKSSKKNLTHPIPAPPKKLIPGQKISKNWWSFSAKLNQQHLRLKLSPNWWAFNYLIIEISLGNLVQRDSWQTEGFWKAAFVGGRENVETGFSFFGRWLYSCTLSHTYKSLGTWIIAFFSTCNTFLLHFWKYTILFFFSS